MVEQQNGDDSNGKDAAPQEDDADYRDTHCYGQWNSCNKEIYKSSDQHCYKKIVMTTVCTTE